MQKLCFILFGIIITTSAFAADLCVRNDAMVVAMDPLFDGTVASYNNTTKVWSTRFSYGTISGIAACDLYNGGSDCGPVGRVATNQNMSPYDQGANYSCCYCKILKPVESLWIYSGHNRCNGSSYTSPCAQTCATLFAKDLSFRRVFYRSLNDS